MSSRSEFTDGATAVTGEDDEVSDDFLLALTGKGGTIREAFELSDSFVCRIRAKI